MTTEAPTVQQLAPERRAPFRGAMVAMALLAIVAIAFAARFYDIGRLCLHYDESWNQELATGRGSQQLRLESGKIHHGVPRLTSLNGAAPWWTIPTHLDLVTHPPLFSIVLRLWRDLAGDSDVAGRALSAVISAISVLLMFDLVRLLHGKSPALWAALIMALAGSQIELGQQIRPYTLMLLLAMCACDALLRLELRGPSIPRTIALATSTLAMMLTHYFAVGPAIALGAYTLLRLRGRALRNALTAFAVAAIIFIIVWGPFLLRQRNDFKDAAISFLGEDPSGSIGRTLLRLAELPVRLLFEPQESTYPMVYGGAVLLLTPLLLRRRPELLLWCVWLGGTAGFITALDLAFHSRHLHFTRYLMFAGPAVFAILTVIAPATRPRARHAISAAAALSCAMALPAVYSIAQPDIRPLAKYLDEHVQPGEPIIFYRSGDAPWYGRVLFLGANHYAKDPAQMSFMILENPPDREASSLLANYPAVWFVSGTGAIGGQDLFERATASAPELIPYVAIIQRVTRGQPSTQSTQ